METRTEKRGPDPVKNRTHIGGVSGVGTSFSSQTWDYEIQITIERFVRRRHRGRPIHHPERGGDVPRTHRMLRNCFISDLDHHGVLKKKGAKHNKEVKNYKKWILFSHNRPEIVDARAKEL